MLESDIHLLLIPTNGETGTNKILHDFGKFVNDLELLDFDEISYHILDYPDFDTNFRRALLVKSFEKTLW